LTEGLPIIKYLNATHKEMVQLEDDSQTGPVSSNLFSKSNPKLDAFAFLPKACHDAI